MTNSDTFDLTADQIPPGQQLVAKNKWPIIGEKKPAACDGAWLLEITGKIKTDLTLSLNDLAGLSQTTLNMDIHCVTRWTRPKVQFSGVLLRDVLELVALSAGARFVSFVSRSDRNHSSSLPLDVALKQMTLIALQVDGQDLETDHGGPVRNVVPGRYFYKSVKWLRKIVLLSEDRLGFWEAESGYHNNADPWQEERYMATTIDRRTAAKLISSRDFSGLDLRSIDASRRELKGLIAAQALLRDANFRKSDLVDADFSDANLSNAHFEEANLGRVRFIRSDLEGANLSGADLRGAEFRDCSLIGASFFEKRQDGSLLAAQMDDSTILPENLLEPLTPTQRDFVLANRR